MKSAHLAALLLAALTSFTPLQAMAAGAPAAPLPAESGEVIVGFKPEAQSVRKHALAARADAAAVQATLALRAGSLGARLGRTLHSGAAVGERAQVMHAPGLDAATLARLLQADPDVAYAVPNGRKRLVAAPNDPLYPATAPGVRPGGPASGQWYLRAPDATVKSAIDIEGAWARTTGSGNVVVAVLDTGVRFEHPDLARRLLRGYDFVSNGVVANDGDGRDADPTDPGDWVTSADKDTATFKDCGVSDSSWHGTATASLIGAATNSTPASGMAGAAPGVMVLPVRVLGKCFGNDSDIIAGMKWAAGISIPGVPNNPTPAKVLNVSLGGNGVCKANYQAAVDEIIARGVTIVAAAGNSAGGAVSEPANCRGVIGVLALRHAGTKVGFSDLGPEISIAAPGGNCINITPGSPCIYPIVAATNTGKQCAASPDWTDSFEKVSVGTSFSSPLVAAVAALMVSRQPALTPAQVRDTLQSTARAFPTSGAETTGETIPVCRTPLNGVSQQQCYCTTAVCGAGMLDAAAALAAVSGTAPFVSFSVEPAAPNSGESMSLSITGLQTSSGSGVSSYTWRLLDGGGAATGFSSSTNASTASLVPSGAGTMRLELEVADQSGGTSKAEYLVPVYGSPPDRKAYCANDASASSGGGGASSGVWVAGVALAAALLRRLRPAGGLKAARRRA